MKKLILVCAFATIYLGSFAQNDSTRNKMNYDKDNKNDNQKKNTDNQYQKNDNTNKNCAYKMENGKIMMIVDGKTVVMDKEMTTKNGTIVMMDGTVKMKDGKTMKMKEGDCMDMSGKMIVVKNSQIKNDKTDNK